MMNLHHCWKRSSWPCCHTKHRQRSGYYISTVAHTYREWSAFNQWVNYQCNSHVWFVAYWQVEGISERGWCFDPPSHYIYRIHIKKFPPKVQSAPSTAWATMQYVGLTLLLLNSHICIMYPGQPSWASLTCRKVLLDQYPRTGLLFLQTKRQA